MCYIPLHVYPCWVLIADAASAVDAVKGWSTQEMQTAWDAIIKVYRLYSKPPSVECTGWALLVSCLSLDDPPSAFQNLRRLSSLITGRGLCRLSHTFPIHACKQTSEQSSRQPSAATAVLQQQLKHSSYGANGRGSCATRCTDK